MARAQYELVDSHFLGKFVQGVPLHELTPGVGQEALALAWEMLVYDVAHNSIEDGVAQKLKPLVVDGLALGVSSHDALVHQSQFVEADIVRIKTDDVEQRRIKLLLLTEREPYSINDIIQHTS